MTLVSCQQPVASEQGVQQEKVEDIEKVETQKRIENEEQFLKLMIIDEPLRYVDVKEEGVITSKLLATVSFREKFDFHSEGMVTSVVGSESRSFSIPEEYNNWSIEDVDFDEGPYFHSMIFNQEYNASMFFSQQTMFKLGRGRSFYTIGNDIITSGASPIPTSAKVGDTIRLHETSFVYTVYASAYQWLENNPDYKRAKLDGGTYEVTHEYEHSGRRFINLNGVGWLLVPLEEERIMHSVGIDRHNASLKYKEGKMTFPITQSYSNLYKYSKLKANIYVSNEQYTYNKSNLVTTYEKQMMDMESIVGTGVEYAGTTYHGFVEIGQVKDQYITVVLFVDYEYDGETFENIMVDEYSFLVE